MKRTKSSKKQVFLNILTNTALLLGVVAVSLVSFIPTKTTAASAVVSEGNRSGNSVCLMINVYWGNEYIEPMLNVLKEKGVTTTFFVGGMWVAKYPELLTKIYENGHEIGNHGYNHKDHNKLSLDANKQEIQACHAAVKNVLGIDMTLFAPPSGAYNQNTLNAATALNQKVIMWTRDTIDWRDKNTQLIYSRATKNLTAGDLILMHPTKNTLEALPLIIDAILNKGLTVAPVSKTIA